MNIFAERLQQIKEQKAVKAPAHYFQEVALEVLEYLEAGAVKSQVFKWAKTREWKLKACVAYMKQRNIKSYKYLCKLMSL